VIVSIGGYDALANRDLLRLRVSSSAQALQQFAGGSSDSSAPTIPPSRVLQLGPRTVLCTVYNGALDPAEAVIARTALTLFNDVVLRSAIERGIDVLELRRVCGAAADHVNNRAVRERRAEDRSCDRAAGRRDCRWHPTGKGLERMLS
jgi:hypothetical protein